MTYDKPSILYSTCQYIFRDNDVEYERMNQTLAELEKSAVEGCVTFDGMGSPILKEQNYLVAPKSSVASGLATTRTTISEFTITTLILGMVRNILRKEFMSH